MSNDCYNSLPINNGTENRPEPAGYSALCGRLVALGCACECHVCKVVKGLQDEVARLRAQRYEELTAVVPKLESADKTEALRRERGSRYGEFMRNMKTTWAAVGELLEQHYQIKLAHPIPAHIGCLAMVIVKMNRAAADTPHHQDNYDDALAYLRMANEASVLEKKADK